MQVLLMIATSPRAISQMLLHAPQGPLKDPPSLGTPSAQDAPQLPGSFQQLPLFLCTPLHATPCCVPHMLSASLILNHRSYLTPSWLSNVHRTASPLVCPPSRHLLPTSYTLPLFLIPDFQPLHPLWWKPSSPPQGNYLEAAAGPSGPPLEEPPSPGTLSSPVAPQLPGSFQQLPGEGVEAPLLTEYSIGKKAGFRDAGFVFAPRKSWWAGLFLVIVSVLVMAVTLLTAGS